jgi:hypothetical protein
VKHVGIVARSAEGAALCYRTICREALTVVGRHDHPRITLDSIPMARWLPAFDAGDYEGVAGTRCTMAGSVYLDSLRNLGIDVVVPDGGDFEEVDRIIFAELVDGVFTGESRQAYNRVIGRLADRGCDAVALACTEIPLLVRADESPLPTAAGPGTAGRWTHASG